MLTIQTLLNKMTEITLQYINDGYTIRSNNSSMGGVIARVEFTKPNAKSFIRISIEQRSGGSTDLNKTALMVREMTGTWDVANEILEEEYFMLSWGDHPTTALFTAEEATEIKKIRNARYESRRTETKYLNPAPIMPLIKRQRGWKSTKVDNVVAYREGTRIVVRSQLKQGNIVINPRNKSITVNQY